MISSLLEVQPTLIESINKSALNKSSIPKPTTVPEQIHPAPTLNLQTQQYQNNHQPLRFW